MQKAGKWREVRAESLPIKQETSAERITGRSGQRKSGENANAGRLARKGKPDRTESRLRVEAIVRSLPLLVRDGVQNERAGI
jgi:hypothetical protein